MQLQECLAEASGESRCGLGDAALGSCKLCSEAGQEVVLGLLRGQDRDRRQNAECISGEEDYVLSSRAMGDAAGNLLHDLLDVIDRIGDTGVLGHALVSEIELSGLVIDRDVLKQSISLDCAVDIGFCILVEVDNLCVAAALEVEDTLVVPAVLIIADQQSLGICGKGGLAGAGQTEEDGGVLALKICVCRAVHRGNALQRQVVVHHGEHTLLHLTAVPGVDDDLLSGGDVEDNGGLGVQAELFVVLNLCLGCVVDDEIRLEVCFLFRSGLDEHISYEMCLPCNLHDEADSHSGVLVGAAEAIDNIELLVGELLLCDLLDSGPCFLRSGMVVVLVLLACPPDGVLGVLIHDNELVLGRTAGVDTGEDVDSTQLTDVSDFIAGQLGLGLLLEQLLVGRIVDDFSGASDAILG